MPQVLHILTAPAEPFVQDLIARQRACHERTVTVVDLTAPEPDYRALLEAIFAADSVAVW
jgi:hypothetical protein